MKEEKKIVLIGPVYPYKGGLAHYTSLMCQALRERYEVYMMSYKLQYPRFLFKKEQKDYGNDRFAVKDTDFAINTANPFNWISVAGKISKMKPDAVIIQWWHPYFSPCYFTLCRLLRKTKILFVCHNVFPHERFPLDRFLTKMVLRSGNAFIVQSSQDEADLLGINKNVKYTKTVHPTYNAFKIKDMSLEEGRRILGIAPDEKVLLFFGFVREYKGLRHLLKAMPKVTEKLSKVRLMVVGDFDGNKDEYLKMIEELGVSSAIDIHDGYIPDEEIEKYFAASDVVVLPYESATQSGIVQIAYGFEKPVIATAVGGLPDVVIDGKTGFLSRTFEAEEIADCIIRFFMENRQQEFARGIREESYKYSWENMTDVITNLIS